MKKIGFIGLGAMGNHMARNLTKKGFAVTVYDLNPEAVQSLVNAGAKAAESCAAAAQNADIVITVLPADRHMKAVMMNDNGVFQGASPGTTIIDMTTLSPHTSIEVAAEAQKRGLFFLDAPVSGGTIGAEKGTLTIMVGGEKQLFEQVRDVLEAMGKTIYHVGGIGIGETVKMVNQILVACNMLAISEAFVLGVKLGADPDTLLNVIKVSAGNSFLIEHRLPNYVFPGDFEQPGFALDLLRKDVGIAMDSAREEKVAISLTSIVYQMLTQASSAGFGNMDMSSVIKVVESSAGVSVRKTTKTED
ncbi:2-hydroxy-3-oxopropionate reductase [Desulfosarcina widdelii]|uniref:2-hydroxy-3-oxopropionate reductase n=2 Tax=Desulfosarcina widdelii TaxID=947919 RepID=A0A5K7YV21_9BACT|nr:2-hydroxy-3-oxopropionate reductase [Desulfosarcina widdelii]